MGLSFMSIDIIEGTRSRGQHFRSPHKHILREICKAGRNTLIMYRIIFSARNAETHSVSYKLYSGCENTVTFRCKIVP
jgi:hypothetical protein